MIGKPAYNKESGFHYGLVQKDHGSTWHVVDASGNALELLKGSVIFDAEIAKQLRSNASVNPVSAVKKSTNSHSGLAIFNGLVGALCILGGIILLIQLWPEKAPTGYENKGVAYIPAVSSAISGFISGLIFFNFVALLNKK